MHTHCEVAGSGLGQNSWPNLGATMTTRSTFLMAFLALCVISAWTSPTTHLLRIPQPATIFTVGPGTIISVRILDLPFVEAHYAVQYKTDDGELIEVWHAGRNVFLVKGMHGMLTYSTRPERILRFRVVPPILNATPPETNSPGSLK